MNDFHSGSLVFALAPSKDGQGPSSNDPTPGGSVPYSAFSVRHKDYDAGYWARCRALYRGGRKLLGDKELLSQIMKRKGAEPEHLYEQRLAEAFYYSYPAEIIDHIIAGLDSDPIRVKRDGDELPPECDYRAFLEDVSRSDSSKNQPIGDFMRTVVCEAEQVGCAWVRLDLPRPPEDAEAPTNLLQQDQEGHRRVWAEVAPIESVIHWQEDELGELEWVLTCESWVRQGAFWASPMRVERFSEFSRTGFRVWEVESEIGKPPQPSQMIELKAEGEHSFGRVPFLRFRLPQGLWAMDKLEAIARSHLNSRNDLDWAERRALLPVLYEFHGSEVQTLGKPVSVHQQSPNRSVSTPRSQSRVQRRGADDRAEWVGPPVGPFAEARASCAEKRTEMHRVMYQMALAVDYTSAAAMGRSEGSKDQDSDAARVVLSAIGNVGREFVNLLMKVVEVARGDATDVNSASAWSSEGWSEFRQEQVDKLVSLMVEVDGLDIPSATARVALLERLLRALLTGMDDETFGVVLKELRQAITQDQLVERATLMPIPPGFAPAGDDDGDEEDDENGEQARNGTDRDDPDE